MQNGTGELRRQAPGLPAGRPGALVRSCQGSQDVGTGEEVVASTFSELYN